MEIKQPISAKHLVRHATAACLTHSKGSEGAIWKKGLPDQRDLCGSHMMKLSISDNSTNDALMASVMIQW